MLALAAHIAGILAIGALLPDWRGIALLAAVIFHGVLFWHRRFRRRCDSKCDGAGTKCDNRVTAIRFNAGGWVLGFGESGDGQGADSQWYRARLLQPVFCHGQLVVMRFHCDAAESSATGAVAKSAALPRLRRRIVTIAITNDSCSTDDFRRLRLLARHLPASQLWAPSR